MSRPATMPRYRPGRWVAWSARHAVAVVLAAVLLSGLALDFLHRELGINTDTADMLSPELPYRQTYEQYKSLFPVYGNTLTVVIDAQVPDLAHAASRALAARLADEHALFEWVYLPGSGAFMERHGLLYYEAQELADLTDSLARAQPLLSRLVRDPGTGGLFDTLTEAVDAIADDDGDEPVPPDFIRRMDDVIDAVLAGRNATLSWQELISGADSDPGDRRRFLIARPRPDYRDLLPAGPAMDRIRSIARTIDPGPDTGVRVRITGGTALEHEELLSAKSSAESAGLLALAAVAVILAFGLRSARLIAASLLTLIAGLVWTAAFAAWSIGHLNLISVAFAALYIGLGIDYSIHFCLHYRELMQKGHTHDQALRESADDVGASLFLCAITTGLGFYAFIPTAFTGVSELGIIGGTGMFISLFANLTLLPALLSLPGLRPSPPPRNAPDSPPRQWLTRPRSVRIVIAAMLLGTGAMALVPGAQFDHDPLNLRDPESESVSTYRELLADDPATGWSAVALAGGRLDAERLAQRLERLPEVGETRTLGSFIPDDQETRLALIEEMSWVLGDALDGPIAITETGGERLRASLGTLRAAIRRALDRDGTGPALRRTLQDFDRTAARLAQRLHLPAGDAALPPALTRALLGTLPEQLRLLGAALDAGPVREATLPDTLRQRWVAPDGHYRVEIPPAAAPDRPDTLRRFVSAVRTVAPDATDSPVIMLESGDAAVQAFRQAFLLALLLITVLLFALLPRRTDTIYVIGPLVFAGVLTVAAMVLTGLKFNFANLIALPLLFGIGVDNGIHMVRRHRAGNGSDLLRSSTARAVLLSGLTTLGSFGTLAFSTHPGMASMGMLLTFGILLVLGCTLILLPALLELLTPTEPVQ